MSAAFALIVAWNDQTRVFTTAFTAGRGEDDAVRTGADLFASPRHAEFAPGPDGWMVRDGGSTNGTWVGDGWRAERVWDWRVLAKGDKVRIGRTVLTVIPAG